MWPPSEKKKNFTWPLGGPQGEKNDMVATKSPTERETTSCPPSLLVEKKKKKKPTWLPQSPRSGFEMKKILN